MHTYKHDNRCVVDDTPASFLFVTVWDVTGAFYSVLLLLITLFFKNKSEQSTRRGGTNEWMKIAFIIADQEIV